CARSYDYDGYYYAMDYW
nr:immunoglobulin heavy chain junction region [Mus musculus]